ncbi:MAG: hypothetical protein GX434_07485 [Peptococcaceae bacterium]|nr:hypothetical protein [Peptococcaceae bacterium]
MNVVEGSLYNLELIPLIPQTYTGSGTVEGNITLANSSQGAANVTLDSEKALMPLQIPPAQYPQRLRIPKAITG